MTSVGKESKNHVKNNAFRLIKVEKFTERELKKCADVLTSAFIDNVLYSKFGTDRDKRYKKLFEYNLFSLRWNARYGGILVDEEDGIYRGVLAWIEDEKITLSRIIRGGIIPALFRVGPKAVADAYAITMDAVSGIEGDYLRRPTIGVIPEYQRKGIGKALVLRLMEKSKRENLPPLLGSVRVLKNVELYKKWGGEILKVVQKDGLDVYYMVFKHEKVLKT